MIKHSFMMNIQDTLMYNNREYALQNEVDPYNLGLVIIRHHVVHHGCIRERSFEKHYNCSKRKTRVSRK